MSDTKQHLEHLAEMRALMERSTRFLSLSGLSGAWAGTCALAGVGFVKYWLAGIPDVYGKYFWYDRAIRIAVEMGLNYKSVIVLLAVLVLVTALAGGWFFTARKARRRGERVWDASSKRLLKALLIPLLTGGVFCMALLHWNLPALLAPATLIFYGLALVNGAKYTLRDVEYLGLSEIALGLFGLFSPGFGLELWGLGFGVLHIFYGLMMHIKYDSRQHTGAG